MLRWEAVEVTSITHREEQTQLTDLGVRLVRPARPSLSAGGYGALGSSWERFRHFLLMRDAVGGVRAPWRNNPHSAQWLSEALENKCHTSGPKDNLKEFRLSFLGGFQIYIAMLSFYVLHR